jgi:hypothetical protein
MKVKIQQRSVYHKFAEVEIDIDKKDYQEYIKFNTSQGREWHDIQDYLLENENLYVDKIDDAMSKAEYIHGSGLYDYKGMDEDTNSEWRFECDELKTGGHL